MLRAPKFLPKLQFLPFQWRSWPWTRAAWRCRCLWGRRWACPWRTWTWSASRGAPRTSWWRSTRQSRSPIGSELARNFWLLKVESYVNKIKVFATISRHTAKKSFLRLFLPATSTDPNGPFCVLRWEERLEVPWAQSRLCSLFRHF